MLKTVCGKPFRVLQICIRGYPLVTVIVFCALFCVLSRCLNTAQTSRERGMRLNKFAQINKLGLSILSIKIVSLYVSHIIYASKVKRNDFRFSNIFQHYRWSYNCSHTRKLIPRMCRLFRVLIWTVVGRCRKTKPTSWWMAMIQSMLSEKICWKKSTPFKVRLVRMICCNLIADVGRGGALAETMTFNRRVVGSTLALAAT